MRTTLQSVPHLGSFPRTCRRTEFADLRAYLQPWCGPEVLTPYLSLPLTEEIAGVKRDDEMKVEPIPVVEDSQACQTTYLKSDLPEERGMT